jgi:hypothetical protein
VVCEIEEALQNAEGSSGDTTLNVVKCGLGGALVYRDTPADRQRGLELVEQARDMWLREGSRLYLVPVADVIAAYERARRGDRDGAIPVMRKAANDLCQAGRLGFGVRCTGVLVEALLDRGTESDLAEAQSAIDRLAKLPADEGLVMRDIWLLRMRAQVARARGDEVTYRDYRDRYRAMATALGFEGHMAMANSMM